MVWFLTQPLIVVIGGFAALLVAAYCLQQDFPIFRRKRRPRSLFRKLRVEELEQR